jgi:hypothetical protein
MFFAVGLRCHTGSGPPLPFTAKMRR